MIFLNIYPVNNNLTKLSEHNWMANIHISKCSHKSKLFDSAKIIQICYEVVAFIALITN